MSIASEISRIRQNVEDSLSAVEDKGVTVPEGSTSDDLPGLIALIQGGGIIINDTIDENGGTVREITAANVIKTQARTGITPTESSQTIVPETGYDAMTSVQINAIPSGSATAPASISGISASVSAGTNTLTLTKTVSVTPSVSAGYVSSGTAGNSNVSLTANVTTKAAATITPGTTAQTIASGTYLTGTQTIAGDANLVGDNILSGKSIFGVSGTVAFQTYYTGSSAPASSLGVNGDIYLQT